MKIVFFGTPDFAVPTLREIIKNGHEVVAVVTAPDKERGRGRKITYTAVKQFALEQNLKVIQPEKLRDQSFIDELKSLNADLFVIVAFRILPAEVFRIPPKGSFNLHGSLLPKYRGAAPIQWALINGESKTGLTTFFLEEKVDTGNIILQKELNILPEDDLGSLHDRMSEVGADLVIETISKIESGNYQLKKQDDSQATPAPKITKEVCEINWEKTAVEIHNLIRGLCPFPGAFFMNDDKLFKVYKSKVIEEDDLTPGQIVQTKKEIFVGTTKGKIQILEIRPEGRKRMTAEEFLRGYKLKEN